MRVLTILLVLASCTTLDLEKVNEGDVLNVSILGSYDDYINDNYTRVPVDVVLLEKDLGDVNIQIEFSDDLKTIHSKTWIFPLDSNLTNEENVAKVIEEYEIDLISPLCSVDDGYYFFDALTKSNDLLQGKILKNSYSNAIAIVFFPRLPFN